MRKKIFKNILLILGIMVVFSLLMSKEFKDIVLNIKSVPISIVFITSGLQILTMILLAMQWKSVIALTGRKVSFKDVFLVNIKGNVVDSITPGVKVGGELARVYELKNTLGIDTSNASVIVGFQKTISLLSFLFLTLISLIWFNITLGSEYEYYLYLFSIAVLIFTLLLSLLILICLKPYIINNLLDKLSISKNLRDKLNKGISEYHRVLSKLLSKKKNFLYQLIFGILIWIIFAFKMLLVVKGFGISMSFVNVAAITYLTYVVGMIPLLPGSIGSFESCMITLLTIQRVPIDISISISIVFRFITFWFEFLLSLIIVILYKVFFLYQKGDNYVRRKA